MILLHSMAVTLLASVAPTRTVCAKATSFSFARVPLVLAQNQHLEHKEVHRTLHHNHIYLLLFFPLDLHNGYCYDEVRPHMSCVPFCQALRERWCN